MVSSLIKPNMLDSMYKDMGLKKSGLVIGDVREELARDTMKQVEKVVNEKMHLPSYYLLIAAKNFGKDIKTTVITMLEYPPKMLGTICYKIDNKRGVAERLWTLPLNVVMPEGLVESGEVVEGIIDSGKGMPIG